MRVVEVFATLQGEGVNTGRPAIFVRFAGCNLWSGHHKDRARDASRNLAACPLWCDTDFRKGDLCSGDALVELVRDKMSENANQHFPLIVFTGGEPLLQLSTFLLQKIKTAFPNTLIAVETNGTIALHERRELIDYICVSPKTPLQTIRVVSGTELKIVYPAIDPSHYQALSGNFDYLWISPQAQVGKKPGISHVDDYATQQAIDFCLRNPQWRLSTQDHKIWNVR